MKHVWLVLGIALAGCSSDDDYPNEGDIKALLIAQLGQGSIVDSADVDDLACSKNPPTNKIACTYTIAAVPHVDQFIKTKDGKRHFSLLD